MPGSGIGSIADQHVLQHISAQQMGIEYAHVCCRPDPLPERQFDLQRRPSPSAAALLCVERPNPLTLWHTPIGYSQLGVKPNDIILGCVNAEGFEAPAFRAGPTLDLQPLSTR